MRSSLLLPFLIGAGFVFACSSFSEAEDASARADAGGDTGADSPGSASDAPADDASPSTDICAGQAPTFEYAGLYIADGYLADANAGTMVPTATVLRAPIRCDGTVGAFQLQPEMVSRAFYGGGAAVVGGVPLLLNGESDTPPQLVGYAFVGQLGANGTITSFLPTNDAIVPMRWRFATAATASSAYMIGGQSTPNPSMQDVTRLSVATAGSTATLSAMPMTALPEPLVRGSAAIARDTLVVYGGMALYATMVGADGTLAKWQTLSTDTLVSTQFDGIAIADGDNVYLIGGEHNNVAFSWVDCAQSPPAWRPGPNLAGSGVMSGVAAVSRGTAYILREGDTSILTAKLGTNGISLEPGPSIPLARLGAAIFVR